MRPILGPFDKSMLHRIGVAISDMRTVIRVVPDVMLPESPLPHAAFAPRDMARPSHSLGHLQCESRLDHTPPRREIRIAFRQRPHAVQVIRQHHLGVNRKWPLDPRDPHRIAQPVDFTYEQIRTPIRQPDGKEVRGARDQGAMIL